ncbi:hypothetical protein [Meiothermus sp. CFH 77666]|uniref:hypothetical protein n=1 Tax=Meiothermus sp. CFH 77666 TaxID=2817942 RepID=UPI001AA0477B|nr:hypothetical protein [Meiothermus sp. CFH 77666]MBO1436937.1 hypothetical protein [Meiothermus sp. CFH 77666]
MEWILGGVVGIGPLVLILLITAPFADVFKKKSRQELALDVNIEPSTQKAAPSHGCQR